MNDNLMSNKLIDITLSNNDSDVLIPIDYHRMQSGIIKDMNQWNLSIIRFKIPSGGISKYILKKNTGDHIIYMSLTNPNISSSEDITSIIPFDTFEIYSPIKLIDVINNGIINAYKKLCPQYDTIPGWIGPSPTNTYSFSQTLNYTQSTREQTLNFAGFNPFFPSNNAASKAYYITFKIDNLICEEGSNTQPRNFQIVLSNGTTDCILIKNAACSNIQDLTNTSIEDGNFISKNLYFVSGEKLIKPFEPLSKLYNNAASDSTWKLKIDFDGDAYNTNSYTLDISMTVIFMNPDGLPKAIYPPFFSVDKSTGLIAFNYSQTWYQSGINIGFSKLLRNMLDNFDYFNVSGIDYLDIPQQTTGNSMDNNKQITQLAPSLYMFTQVNAIEFTTNMGVENEVRVVAENQQSSTAAILTDFLPDPSTIANDYYIYNATSDYRKYRFQSSTSLNNISVIAWVVYTDGSKRRISLRRGENANIKFMLTPV